MATPWRLPFQSEAGCGEAASVAAAADATEGERQGAGPEVPVGLVRPGPQKSHLLGGT